MYIYKGYDAETSKFLVYDDTDGVTEGVFYPDLKRLVNAGVEIDGVFMDDDTGELFDVDDNDLLDFLPKIKEPTRQSNLTKAKKAKNDEFYTQLKDIEAELNKYPVETFKDKVIYLPTDVPITDGNIKQSQFVRFFQMNAHRFQFKKLIATCLEDKSNTEGFNRYIVTRRVVGYCTPENQANSKSPLGEIQDEDGIIKYTFKDGHKTAVAQEVVNEIIMDENGKYEYPSDGRANQYYRYTDNYDTDMMHCEPDGQYASGDFRSKECQGYFEEADIVITNPPFSLFREFFATLVKHNNKFIIIGNMNAITYKEFFPYIKDNKVWLGHKFGGMMFEIADSYEMYGSQQEIKDGKRLVGVSNGCWFTNVDIHRRHEPMVLYQRYYDDPSKYPKYDNYDAINVDKTKDIPEDYYECIGVPISFLDKYDPDQFEIIQFRKGNDGKDLYYIREREGSTLFPHNHTQEDVVKYICDNYGYDRSELTVCNGVMGVPISFLDKYCPEQFAIFGHEHDIHGCGGDGLSEGQFMVDGKGKYKRILVRRR